MPVMSRFDPDYYALTVGNHILGGNGSNSRLMQKIREEKGLAYSVYSYLASMEVSGPFEMGLQTRNAQADEALALLEETLQIFIDNGPEQSELDLAKKNIIGGFALRLDSNSKLLDQLSVIGFYQLPFDYLDNYPRQIELITADDVRKAFRNRIKPEQNDSHHRRPAGRKQLVRSPSKSSPKSQVRIIAGDWRGRKIPVPDLQGLRPTSDRIRETLFNWLSERCRGASVLDCFAGSGALGFEAASRGAKSVTLVELNKKRF